MLTMPVYAGKRTHHGEIVADGTWPPLIDYEEWQKLQSLIDRPERRREPREWAVKYLLTGIAVCDICGAGTRVGKQRRGRARTPEAAAAMKASCTCANADDGIDACPAHYRTYVCTGVPGKGGFHVAMKVAHLDQIVTELVIARLERPDFLALIGDQNPDAVDEERRALLDEIAGYREYLDQVRAQAAERKRMDLLFDQEERIQPKIDTAQERLERLSEIDPMVARLAGEGDIRAGFAGLTLVEKRRVISAVVTPRIQRVGRGWTGRTGPNPDRVIPVWR